MLQFQLYRNNRIYIVQTQDCIAYCTICWVFGYKFSPASYGYSIKCTYTQQNCVFQMLSVALHKSLLLDNGAPTFFSFSLWIYSMSIFSWNYRFYAMFLLLCCNTGGLKKIMGLQMTIDVEKIFRTSVGFAVYSTIQNGYLMVMRSIKYITISLRMYMIKFQCILNAAMYFIGPNDTHIVLFSCNQKKNT